MGVKIEENNMTINRYLTRAREEIKRLVEAGKRDFILYPFGERGWMVKSILNVEFDIEEVMLVDNILCNDYSNIHSLDEIQKVMSHDLIVLITSDRNTCFKQIREELYGFVGKNKCIDLFGDFYYSDTEKKAENERIELNNRNLLNGLIDKSLAKYRNENMDSNVYHPKNTKSVFFLPFMFTDFIQRSIFLNDDYYESKVLKYIFREYKNGKITEEIKKKDGIIIDIGANIGNHTLYYANELDVKVIAFEPVKNTFSILQKNIEINGLGSKVQLYNMGLSDKKDRASMQGYNLENIGACPLDVGTGEIEISTLDDCVVEDNITFIKIDVEGMELNVLRGSKRILTKNMPYVQAEVWDNFDELNTFMLSLGYNYINLGGPDYLFFRG